MDSESRPAMMSSVPNYLSSFSCAVSSALLLNGNLGTEPVFMNTAIRRNSFDLAWLPDDVRSCRKQASERAARSLTPKSTIGGSRTSPPFFSEFLFELFLRLPLATTGRLSRPVACQHCLPYT
jgi:hypothetical protein